MKHLSNEIASFHPSPDDGYACLYFGHAFSSIPPAFSISSSLAGDPSPSLLITFSHLSPSLSLSLISFLLLLLPGIEQRSRISPPKKEGGEGGRVISGPSPSSPLLPLLPSCLPGRRWCPAVVWTTTVSAGRGEGTGNGEDDQSIFVVVIASRLASLSLSLALSPSASV